MPKQTERPNEASRSSPDNLIGSDQPTTRLALSAALIHRLSEWLSTTPAPKTEYQIVATILEMIAEHFESDLVEINLFDESLGFFLPHRLASKKAKSYIKNLAVDRYPLSHGFTGWLAEHQRPLFIPDLAAREDLTPVSGLEEFPFQSYLGVPLRWDGKLLGTLEIVHASPGTYAQSHAEAAEMLATHIAMTLYMQRVQRNLLQLRAQQKTADAIHKFADQLDDLQSVWEGSSQTLVEFLDCSLLGIFLSDASKNQLTTPYLSSSQGNKWKITETNIEVARGSDLSSIWMLQEFWLSNAVDRETLTRLGLDHLVKPKDLNKLLLVSLLAGGERVGLVIVGRSKDQPDFVDEEIRSLQSLSRQIGTLLYSSQKIARNVEPPGDNAVGEAATALEQADAAISPERMSELIRLSAELTTSIDLDRSLKRVLALCNHLLSADRGVFINYSSGELGVQQVVPEFETREAVRPEALEHMVHAVSEWLITQRQSLLISDLATDGRWSLGTYSSLCAVPCTSESDISGVLLFFADRRDAFGPDELKIAQIVAHQMASALNNSYLYSVIREQADRLGLMLRSQQIESSQSNAILESIADGVIVTDASHKVILFNDAAERILNLPASQIVGKQIFDHIGIFGMDTLEWSETIRGWESTPAEQHQRPLNPGRMALDDGRIISILPAPVVLGGDFQGTISIFRDITRDVEVDRLKSEFVATVSHELRTPMTSIKGFVDLMLMGVSGELNDQQRHFLDIVRTNTNRLEILVNDLLDVSRIEAGKASLVFQELDVHQLLLEMEQYIQHRCQEESKSMQFSYADARALPPIWGDLERVRQILANLVENSFDYTPEGGSIQMQARQVDGYIEIEVKDSGMGISLEEQERIFERFYRGEQALIMGVSGTGLGLAIVVNLVEMHQGRIWVTSDGPGKGSTFTISLPIATEIAG